MFRNAVLLIIGVMCVTMAKPVKKASASSSKFITIENVEKLD